MSTLARFSTQGLTSAADFAAWRWGFAQALWGALGLELTGAAGGLERMGVLRREEPVVCAGDHHRQKVYLEAPDGAEIPCYVLRPHPVGTGNSGAQHQARGGEGARSGEGNSRQAGGATSGPNECQGARRPLVLALHGHDRLAKERYAGLAPNEDAGPAGREDVGAQSVNEGYVTLAPDVRGFGETRMPEDLAAGAVGSCATLQRRGLMAGRPLLGQRVAETMALLDYGLDLPEVDRRRVALVGHSGGATVAMLTAALDERVSAVVISSYLCTFEASILAIEHCICNVIPGILTLGEMPDLAGLIAPRPLLAVHGEEDPIYPATGTAEAFGQLRRLYQLLGHADDVELYFGAGGHRFFPEPVWPFLRRHLGVA